MPTDRKRWNTSNHFEKWCEETITLCRRDLMVNPLKLEHLKERFLQAYNAKLYPSEAVLYIAETYNLHIPDYRKPPAKPGEELKTVAIFVGSTYITTQRVKEKDIATLSDKIRSVVPKGMTIKLTVIEGETNEES